MSQLKVFTNKPKADDDEDDSGEGSFVRMFNTTSVINSADVYLDEPVKDVAYYRNLVYYMHQMQEHDSLNIWIDTPGGYLDGALAIIDAMHSSEGKVQAIVTGRASSAGSLIALSAPDLIIGERARFMCHAVSYGAVGKQGDVESEVDYSREMLRKVLSDAYEGFLKPEELEMLLIGKTYWMDSPEVNARLEARQEYQEALRTACSSPLEQIAEEAKVLPKKKPRTPKKPT